MLHRGTVLWNSQSGLRRRLHLQWLVATTLLLSGSAKLSSSASIQSTDLLQTTTTTDDFQSPVLQRPPNTNDTYPLPAHPVLPVPDHVLPRPPLLGPTSLPVPQSCACRSSSWSTVLRPTTTAQSIMCISAAAILSMRWTVLIG